MKEICPTATRIRSEMNGNKMVLKPVRFSVAITRQVYSYAGDLEEKNKTKKNWKFEKKFEKQKNWKLKKNLKNKKIEKK